MSGKAVYLYAWDLVDDGPKAFTDRLREVGVDSIAPAASYHAGKFIRPHGATGKV